MFFSILSYSFKEYSLLIKNQINLLDEKLLKSSIKNDKYYYVIKYFDKILIYTF